jgi:hypothetical protein
MEVWCIYNLGDVSMDSYDVIKVLFFGTIIVSMGIIAVDNIYSIPIVIPVGDYQIRSLHDGSQISGSFSLGSGYIKQEPQFVYYQKVEKGYQLKTIPADTTTVIEDENTTPYLRVTMYADEGKLFHSILHQQNYYELHVPSGTIIQEWKLDGSL